MALRFAAAARASVSAAASFGQPTRRTIFIGSSSSSLISQATTSSSSHAITYLTTQQWSSSSSFQRRYKSTLLSTDTKIVAPPMVYISGEEMTRYASKLVVKEWIEPYFDLQNWETYDLSCKGRDKTNDQVLEDAVEAGKRIGAIFKEPTVTPSAIQVEEMGLSKPYGSPNGAMRRGWNGITISRDTIHIDGIDLGYKNPVFFERHAIGGEYGAGWNKVGRGTLLTTYIPKDGSDPPFVVDKRDLTDDNNVCVVYHNPYDNVDELAHLFFKRCLEGRVVPYVVTKKTVFKWQEGFWSVMKDVFDTHYKADFIEAGLLEECGGELQHLISDAATMKLIRWRDGGFGMAAHNYDGDMLTDQIAQVHRSPGFITSNLVGRADDGRLIKEFEASHGTVSDLWADHLAGRETSFNPLGLVEAMIGAMMHSATLQMEANPNDVTAKEVYDHFDNFTTTLRRAMHNTFRYGQGTRDMSGPKGYTTEDFINKVAWRLDRYLIKQEMDDAPKLGEPSRAYRRNYDVDMEEMKHMFDSIDKDKDQHIDFDEFSKILVKLGVAPTVKKGGGKVPDV